MHFDILRKEFNDELIYPSDFIDNGYSLVFKLTYEELEKIKSYIYDQWIYRIQLIDKNLLGFIKENKINLEYYHLISSKIDHSKTWNKTSRILPPSFSNWFFTSEFAYNLAKIFGPFSVSDEDFLGWPNFYWRIVRPNKVNDVGPLHRDEWFWKLNPEFLEHAKDFRRIKVWIAICTEPGLNGLLLEKGSHKRKDIKWSGEFRDGIRKPVIENDDNDLNPELIVRSPGEAIVFDDSLLHGGAINKGKKSRISLEFTMFVKDINSSN